MVSPFLFRRLALAYDLFSPPPLLRPFGRMISYPREYPTSNRRDAPPPTYGAPIPNQQSPYPQPLDPQFLTAESPNS